MDIQNKTAHSIADPKINDTAGGLRGEKIY